MINSDYQAKYIAHELERVYANDDVAKLSGLMFDAQIIPTPHQIDAALFALNSPMARGIILADEVGLGKTIEAGIVIMQLLLGTQTKDPDYCAVELAPAMGAGIARKVQFTSNRCRLQMDEGKKNHRKRRHLYLFLRICQSPFDKVIKRLEFASS